MQHGRLQSFVLLILSLANTPVVADTSSHPNMRIAWPQHWDLQLPERQGPALHLRARERLDGMIVQTLDITLIDTRAAQKPITQDSIEQLARSLRDASLSTSIEKNIPLQEFSSHRGYYFVASDAHFVAAKAGAYRQMLEGVMLVRGYLVNFTLLSNDAFSVNTQAMVDALGELKIE